MNVVRDCLPHRFALASRVFALALTVVGGGFARAQGAFNAASASSKPDDAPREALQKFLKAIVDGDPKTAYALISYAKPENRKICESVLSEAAAQHRLSVLIGETYKDDPAVAAVQTSLAVEDESILKRLKNAKVDVKGDAAQVVVDATVPAFVMVKKGGKWLVDFEATQGSAGPLPTEREAAEAAKRAGAYDQIAAAIRKKEVASLATVRDLVRAVQVQMTVAPAGDGGVMRMR